MFTEPKRYDEHGKVIVSRTAPNGNMASYNRKSMASFEQVHRCRDLSREYRPNGIIRNDRVKEDKGTPIRTIGAYKLFARVYLMALVSLTSCTSLRGCNQPDKRPEYAGNDSHPLSCLRGVYTVQTRISRHDAPLSCKDLIATAQYSKSSSTLGPLDFATLSCR